MSQNFIPGIQIREQLRQPVDYRENLPFVIEDLRNGVFQGLVPKEYIEDFKKYEGPPFHLNKAKIDVFRKLISYLLSDKIFDSIHRAIEKIDYEIRICWHIPTINQLLFDLENFRKVINTAEGDTFYAKGWAYAMLMELANDISPQDFPSVVEEIIKVEEFAIVFCGNTSNHSLIEYFDELYRKDFPEAEPHVFHKRFNLLVFLSLCYDEGKTILNEKDQRNENCPDVGTREKLFREYERYIDYELLSEEDKAVIREKACRRFRNIKLSDPEIKDSIIRFITYKINLSFKMINETRPKILFNRIDKVEKYCLESAKIRMLRLYSKMTTIYIEEDTRYFGNVFGIGSTILVMLRAYTLVNFALRETPSHYADSTSKAMIYNHSVNNVVFAAVNNINNLSKVWRFLLSLVYVKITGSVQESLNTFQYIRLYFFYIALRNPSVLIGLIASDFFQFVFETLLIELFVRLDEYSTIIKRNLDQIENDLVKFIISLSQEDKEKRVKTLLKLHLAQITLLVISLIAFIVICVLYWIYKEKTNSFAVFDFKRGWLIMVILKLTKTFFCITNILTNSIFTGCSISFIRKLRYLRYMPRRRLTSFIFEKIWMMFITYAFSYWAVYVMFLYQNPNARFLNSTSAVLTCMMASLKINVVTILKKVKSVLIMLKKIVPVQSKGEGEPAEECPICYEEMRNIYKTPCNHHFHWNCIYHWSMQQSVLSCPCCRQII